MYVCKQASTQVSLHVNRQYVSMYASYVSMYVSTNCVLCIISYASKQVSMEVHKQKEKETKK